MKEIKSILIIDAPPTMADARPMPRQPKESLRAWFLRTPVYARLESLYPGARYDEAAGIEPPDNLGLSDSARIWLCPDRAGLILVCVNEDGTRAELIDMVQECQRLWQSASKRRAEPLRKPSWETEYNRLFKAKKRLEKISIILK